MSVSVYTKETRAMLTDRARDMRERGRGWKPTAREVGVPITTLRRWLDPDLAERMRQASNESKRRRTGKCHDCGATTKYGGAAGAPISLRCHTCSVRHNTIWTKETVIHAIQEWASEHGGNPPTAADWNPGLARRLGWETIAREFEEDTRWPPVIVAQKRFGSWNAAIAAAGFVPRKIGGRGSARVRR